mmetsp:Transcript_75399/g.243935  ORF Transcript_75399/g.243935 Transcript_75399/m.243935 type:complete len:258 (-) Transcript_75399:249-1022(-)
MVHSALGLTAVQTSQGVFRLALLAVALKVELCQTPGIAVLVGPIALCHVDAGATQFLKQGGDLEAVALRVVCLRAVLLSPRAEGGGADSHRVVLVPGLLDLEGPREALGAAADVEELEAPVVRAARVELPDAAAGEELVSLRVVLAEGEALVAVGPVLHDLAAEADVVGPVVLLQLPASPSQGCQLRAQEVCPGFEPVRRRVAARRPVAAAWEAALEAPFPPGKGHDLLIGAGTVTLTCSSLEGVPIAFEVEVHDEV